MTALTMLPMLNSARGPDAANATRALSSSPPRLLLAVAAVHWGCSMTIDADQARARERSATL